jgi:hypothetical protein
MEKITLKKIKTIYNLRITSYYVLGFSQTVTTFDAQELYRSHWRNQDNCRSLGSWWKEQEHLMVGGGGGGRRICQKRNML